MKIPAPEIANYIEFCEAGNWVRPFWYITKCCVNYVNTLLRDYDLEILCESTKLTLKNLKENVEVKK